MKKQITLLVHQDDTVTISNTHLRTPEQVIEFLQTVLEAATIVWPTPLQEVELTTNPTEAKNKEQPLEQDKSPLDDYCPKCGYFKYVCTCG